MVLRGLAASTQSLARKPKEQARRAMTQHTKNLLIAAALSIAFISIWDYFYAFPQMDKQRARMAEQQRKARCPSLAPRRSRPRES